MDSSGFSHVVNSNDIDFTITSNFQDLVARSALKRLQSDLMAGMYSVGSDSIHRSNKYFYPIHTRSMAVEMFQNLVEIDFLGLKERSATASTPVRDNLNKSERQALLRLKLCKDIVIREADKGGAVVVLISENYRVEALHQLSDTCTYRFFKTDFTLII